MSEFKSDLIGNRESAGFAAFLSASELVDLADWAASAKGHTYADIDGVPCRPATRKSTRKPGTLAALPDRPGVEYAVWDAPTADDLPTF